MGRTPFSDKHRRKKRVLLVHSGLSQNIWLMPKNDAMKHIHPFPMGHEKQKENPQISRIGDDLVGFNAHIYLSR